MDTRTVRSARCRVAGSLALLTDAGGILLALDEDYRIAPTTLEVDHEKTDAGLEPHGATHRGGQHDGRTGASAVRRPDSAWTPPRSAGIRGKTRDLCAIFERAAGMRHQRGLRQRRLKT